MTTANETENGSSLEWSAMDSLINIERALELLDIATDKVAKASRLAGDESSDGLRLLSYYCQVDLSSCCTVMDAARVVLERALGSANTIHEHLG